MAARQEDEQEDGSDEDHDAMVARLVASDPSLAEACAVALGEERMRAKAARAEAAEGQSLLAARLLLALELALNRQAKRNLQMELLMRCSALLEGLDGDPAAEQMELEFLPRLRNMDRTSDKVEAFARREHELERRRF